MIPLLLLHIRSMHLYSRSISRIIIHYILPQRITPTCYKYDDNGIRTEKTVNGITTYYTTVAGRITGQYDGTNTLYFRYNAENSLLGFNLNGTEYIYLKNIQGDIEGILDLNGTLVVSYTYDAWGKVLSVTGSLANTVGAINPMRYRGYYLDSETGYYYLQSRYYNPEFCRFINTDEPFYLLTQLQGSNTLNLFEYCNNNPVYAVDFNGNWVFGIGIASSFYVPTGGVVVVSYIWDTYGNRGVLITVGFGVGLLSLSVSFTITISWRKTVYDYIGYGASVGGSYNFYSFFSVGGELTLDRRGVSGVSLSIGVGYSVWKIEGHITGTITVYIPLNGRTASRYSYQYIRNQIKRNLYFRIKQSRR